MLVVKVLRLALGGIKGFFFLFSEEQEESRLTYKTGHRRPKQASLWLSYALPLSSKV